MSADNPPAFPTNVPSPWAQGMTLRDWFAGQAFNALINVAGHALMNGMDKEFAETSVIAKDSYKYADAMLAERAKGGGQ